MKKINYAIRKWMLDRNRNSQKKKYLVKKKKCSITLPIRKIQIKNILDIILSQSEWIELRTKRQWILVRMLGKGNKDLLAIGTNSNWCISCAS